MLRSREDNTRISNNMNQMFFLQLQSQFILKLFVFLSKKTFVVGVFFGSETKLEPEIVLNLF